MFNICKSSLFLLIILHILFCLPIYAQKPKSPESSTKFNLRTILQKKDMTAFDKKMLHYAKAASLECAKALERAIIKGTKTEDEIFSTLYFPIEPLTTPRMFHTFYDDYTDEVIRPIEDRYLKNDSRMVYVVLVDKNGYLPTHNTRYSGAFEGDTSITRNRTKRIFNDTTGIRAARNTKGFLFQVYSRDTGEILADISVPVYVNGKHWGALRIGYNRS